MTTIQQLVDALTDEQRLLVYAVSENASSRGRALQTVSEKIAEMEHLLPVEFVDACGAAIDQAIAMQYHLDAGLHLSFKIFEIKRSPIDSSKKKGQPKIDDEEFGMFDTEAFG